jgi:agmatinase
MMRNILSLLAILPFITARSDPWADEYAGTPDLSFSGITTFAHLPHERCLDNIEGKLDVAILGVPYDNAVSFRPGQFLLTAPDCADTIGARFGPYGIRSGSRRQRPERGYSLQLGLNPYTNGLGTVSLPLYSPEDSGS